MAADRWADDAIERRRLSFGADAEHYDRVRSAYPEDLVDDTIAYAGQELTSTGRALEVGAGTGKATLQFASRGLRIDAFEPDEAMAVVARRRLANAEVAVALQVSDFESADVAEHAYGLLYAAQAWHWVIPERRCELAAAALTPGGAAAIFWNWPAWSRCDLHDAVADAYRRSGAQAAKDAMTHPSAVFDWRTEDLSGSPLFTDVDRRTYDWVERYSAVEYIDLLATDSGYVRLASSERERLFAEVANVIADAGGSFELPYRTFLCLARRAP